MLTSEPIVAAADAVDEVKTFARIDRDDDDALLAALAASSLAWSEHHTGCAAVERGFVETVEGQCDWARLTMMPVTAISGVERVDAGVLAVGDYAVDIDMAGRGRVRLTSGSARLRVRYRAGLAASWGALPELLRNGVVRLAATRYAARDRGDTAAVTPADVVNAWRALRQVRLA